MAKVVSSDLCRFGHAALSPLTPARVLSQGEGLYPTTYGAPGGRAGLTDAVGFPELEVQVHGS